MFSSAQLFETPQTSLLGSSVHGIFQARILLCPRNFPGKNTSMGLSTPGDLPDPGIEPMSPAFSALAGGFFTTRPPGKPPQVKEDDHCPN